MLSLAVLVSGSGSNLQSMIDAIGRDPDFGAEIRIVVSDRSGVRALERAELAGIPTAIVPWHEYDDRAAFSAAVCDAVEAAGAEFLVLAGFMRVLAVEAIRRFPNRIINIHPALLPSFPGAHAIQDALVYGVKLTGVTVHFADEQVDHGPIIAQRSVPVYPGDTAESLHRRIQVEEHALYPDVVKAIADGQISVDGRTVRWHKEDGV